MKKFYTALFLFLFFFIMKIDRLHVSHTSMPQPTEIIKRKADKKKFKIERRKWIESMHRAALGVDWRAMDRQTRAENRIAKLRARQNLIQNGNLSLGTGTEEFAQGLVAGTWSERGSNNLSGRMHCTDIDTLNNLIFAGSAGGNIWMGGLNGSNWNTLNDYIQFSDIKMVRLLRNNVTERLLAVEEKSVFFTENLGLTWIESLGLSGFEDWGEIRQGVVRHDSQKTIFIHGSEWDYRNWNAIHSIYKSDDLGNRFRNIAVLDGSHQLYNLWTNPLDSGAVYLLQKDKIYTIDNTGSLQLFSDIGVDFAITSASKAVLTADSSEQYFYAAFEVNGATHIFGSDDFGVSWNKRKILNTGLFTDRSFSCSVTQPQNLYAGGVDGFRSHNGGYAWLRVNYWWQYYDDPQSKLHADIPEIKPFIDANGNEFLLVCTDGGIFKSFNHLFNVDNIALQGLRISQYYSTYTDRLNGTVIYAGSQDQGFQRKLNDSGGLVNFTQLISGDYGHLVSSNSGSSVWANYPGFTIYYPNARSSTSNLTYDFGSNNNWLWLPPLCEDPAFNNKVYLAGGTSTTGIHLWHLTAGSSSISAQELPYDFSDGESDARISAIAYSPFDMNILYVLTSKGKFFYSYDKGSTWSKSSDFGGPGSHYFYGAKIVVSTTDSGKVFIGGSGYSNPAVFVSENNGSSFEAAVNGLPSTLVYDMDISDDGQLLFAATEVGPYMYIDSTQSWQEIGGVYAPDQTYWSVEFVPVIRTARFATYGRGIWDFALDDPSAISDDLNIRPKDFSLKNYPNPFNPTTTIEFNLHKKAMVTVDIFSIDGQHVTRLMNGSLSSGDHKILWDGLSKHGTQASSGIYIYRLTAGTEQVSRRMMKIK